MQRDDLGHLSVGARADISLLDIIEAHFPFVDVAGVVRESAFLLKPVGLYLGGRFVDPAPRQWEERYYERSSPRF
jgi:predicted amidohydrolase